MSDETEIKVGSRWVRKVSGWLSAGDEVVVESVKCDVVDYRVATGLQKGDRSDSGAIWFRSKYEPVSAAPAPPPAADPAVKTFESGANRSLDAESTRYDLVSPIGLRRLAETYAEGAARYGPGNWLKGIPASDLLNHLMKHVDSFRMGDESEDHLAHAAAEEYLMEALAAYAERWGGE